MIYLDHNATTPLSPEAMAAMMPYFAKEFGNPSSSHSLGRQAKEAVEAARKQVATSISAKNEEIIFTSSGTESNNLAILGFCRRNSKNGRSGSHILISSIEHKAVISTCEALKKEGFGVGVLPVDCKGRILFDKLESSIRPETILVSIMLANNEIGTIQDFKKISEICHERRVCLHTDAVQALGKIALDIRELGADMLSISSHKIFGPKGVGALFVRKGVMLDPIMLGGGQEKLLRSGTENVPGIVGFGAAAEFASRNLLHNMKKMKLLRDRLLRGILGKIDSIKINGDIEVGLPNTLNASFIGIEGEALLARLDAKGICASTAAACIGGGASHVLKAIGLPAESVSGSIRFSVGPGNSEQDIDAAIEVLAELVSDMRRSMSI